MQTIGELREAIKDLPDATPIEGYDGGDTPKYILMYTVTGEDVPEEYRKDDINTVFCLAID